MYFSLTFTIIVLLGVGANADIFQEVKNSRNFTGKVVLVTGSNSGIGKKTVELFSSLGAQVVVTGRKADEIQAVATEVQKLSPKGLKALGVVADITKITDLEHLVNATVKEFGKIDILVNNAGQFAPKAFNTTDFFDGLTTSIDTDGLPALHLIKLALPYLQKTNGSIVNIASILTDVPQQHLLSYAIGKQILVTATKVLAQEFGPYNIRINTVSPGVINSNPEKPKLPAPMLEKVAKTTPLGRVGLSDDVAKSILFLSSTDASYITGIVLDVDGGLILNIPGNFFAN